MLASALSFLTTELNDYFHQCFQLVEDKAVLSARVSLSGDSVTDILNKVSVTLVNLTPESTVRNLAPERPGNGELRLNPAVRLNLQVLFAANFNEYSESLKFLDSTLAFFQSHPFFTPQNAPRLDRSIDRLVLELETLTYHEWSNLWGMLGSKCMPGVVYKVRLVTIQGGAVQDRTPGVSGLGINS